MSGIFGNHGVIDKFPVDVTSPYACRSWLRKSLVRKQKFPIIKNSNFLVDNEQARVFLGKTTRHFSYGDRTGFALWYR